MIRKELGLTREEFAVKLGISRDTVGRWEREGFPWTRKGAYVGISRPARERLERLLGPAGLMANRKLPPNLYARRWWTRGGYIRTMYYCRFKDSKGIRRSFPAGPDIKQARDYCDELLSLNRKGHDFDKPKPKVLTLGAAIEGFFAVKLNKRSLDKDRRSAARLMDFFGEQTPLDDVNQTLRIEQYKNVRRSEKTKYNRPPAYSTINRELAFLTSVLWLNENALVDNPKITLFEEDNTRARTATEAELAAISAELDADTRRLMVAYWETGMRRGEPLALRWSHVDLENDLINLPAAVTKTTRSRLIPISGLFREVLLELKQKKVRAVTDHVYTNPDGSPITKDQVAYRWKQACAAAGVTGLWIHDLRATWCTAKVRAGYDRKFVREISGHKTDYVFDRYVRPTLEDLRAVVKSGEKNAKS